MKKRILICIMAVACIFSLAACNKTVENPDPSFSQNPILDDDGIDPVVTPPPVSQHIMMTDEIGILYDLNADFRIKIEGLEPEEVKIIYPDSTEHKISYKEMEIQTGNGFFYISPYEPVVGTYRAKYEGPVENAKFSIETSDPIMFVEIPEADMNHVKFNIVGMKHYEGEYIIDVIHDDVDNNELTTMTIAVGDLDGPEYNIPFDIQMEPGEYSLYVYARYMYNNEQKEIFNFVPLIVESEPDIVNEPEV